jgi:hypothetical protein
MGIMNLSQNKRGVIYNCIRSRTRVVDKNVVILEKAKFRKEAGQHCQNKGMDNSNSFSIFNDFDQSYFDSLAKASGIRLGKESTPTKEVLVTLVAQEKAHTMLTEARLRKEGENQNKKDKQNDLLEGEDGKCRCFITTS